ncbi:helix-turn-helix transcriptional regulator [Streptomyces hygroscopicus]|uniref:helix-turn-helix transcriptional regulator n=1 Tax=Streptomyces hygroscopicus TaxID=1912 RepID=UPI00363B2F37
MTHGLEGGVTLGTLVFDSDDLEETEDFLCRAYARMRIGSGTPDASRARIRRQTLASISVDELDLDFDMSYSVSPLGKICLCVVHDGTIEDHVFPGVEDAFGPGDVVSFAPPDLPYSGRIRAARYNITMLDPALLSQVAATVDQRTPQPVRLTGHRPHSAAAARHLRQTIGYLRDHALADPAIAEQPLIRTTVSQLLAGSVLAAFPSTALTDPTGPDRNDAHAGTLHRALTYIDDHADQPITVADIAAAAHVSIRAVQYAFRRHLDTTPLAYLRRVRLAHAHHDLATADPQTATVTGIAARWGFFHPARFAALYRETYGTTPSATLRG